MAKEIPSLDPMAIEVLWLLHLSDHNPNQNIQEPRGPQRLAADHLQVRASTQDLLESFANHLIACGPFSPMRSCLDQGWNIGLS